MREREKEESACIVGRAADQELDPVCGLAFSFFSSIVLSASLTNTLCLSPSLCSKIPYFVYHRLSLCLADAHGQTFNCVSGEMCPGKPNPSEPSVLPSWYGRRSVIDHRRSKHPPPFADRQQCKKAETSESRTVFVFLSWGRDRSNGSRGA